MSIIGDKIVEQARTYLGTPWHHLGRSRGGVDCVGLVTCIAYDLRLVNYMPPSYSRKTTHATMLNQFAKFCDRVPVQKMEPGDIPVFMTGGRNHCGIYAGSTLIHAFFKAKEVIEQDWSIWRYHPDPEIRLCLVFRVKDEISSRLG